MMENVQCKKWAKLEWSWPPLLQLLWLYFPSRISHRKNLMLHLYHWIQRFPYQNGSFSGVGGSGAIAGDTRPILVSQGVARESAQLSGWGSYMTHEPSAPSASNGCRISPKQEEHLDIWPEHFYDHENLCLHQRIMPGVHCQLFVGREQVYPCRRLLISSGRILTVCSDTEVVCNNKSPLQNASFCSGDGKTNL